MIRRIKKNNIKLQELSQASATTLRRILHINDILPAKIINHLGNNHYLIALKGQQVIAKSKIDMAEKNLYVQVKSLSPKVNLRLIPFDQSENAEMIIATAMKHNIQLSLINQSIICAILNRKINPEKVGIKSLVNNINAISLLKNEDDLIDLQELIQSLIGENRDGEGISHTLLKAYSKRNQNIFDFLPIDSLPKELYSSMIFKLDGKRFIRSVDHKLLINQEGVFLELNEYQKMLNIVNNRLSNANKSIEMWIHPFNNKFNLMLLEKHYKQVGQEFITQYETTYNFENYGKIKLRFDAMDNNIKITMGFCNQFAQTEFHAIAGEFDELAFSKGFSLINLLMQTTSPYSIGEILNDNF